MSHELIPREIDGMLYLNRARLFLVPLAALVGTGCIDTGPNPNPNPTSPVFRAALRYPTAAGAFGVRTADLNRDGLLDLVTANFEGNSVSVLLGDEELGYALHTDYPAGTAPVAVAIGDLDNDGQLDIITANSGSGNLTFFKGTGEGTFAEGAAVPLRELSSPLDVLAADLNNDDILDLLVADSGSNAVGVLAGPVDPATAVVSFLAAGSAPRSLMVADLDNDLDPDVVATNRNSNNVSVYFNNGAGSFPSPNFIAVGSNPRQTDAIDVDRDGDPDLVTTNPGSSTITLLLNNGSGVFLPGTPVATEALPSKFGKGDFDGNGTTDLAVVMFSEASGNPSLGVADVFFGDGTGGFPSFRRFGIGDSVQDITVVDANSDGQLDLVTADDERDSVFVVNGRGSGVFSSDVRIPTGRQPREILAVDLDRDSDLDLVVIAQLDQEVITYKNNGSGGFTEGNAIALGGAPRGLAVGSLNNDENVDVAVTLLTGTQSVRTFLGKGDGTLLTTGGSTINLAGRGPRSVAIGDMNGDGIRDLVTGDGTSDEISVILADPAGGYKTPVAFESGNYPLNVSLTDANADGKLDVVYLSRSDPDSPTDQAQPRAVLMLGKGDGTLDEDSILRVETGASPTDLVLGDFTGDGRADAVVASPGSNAAYTHVMRNDGFLLPGTMRFAGLGTRAIALAATGPGTNLDIITVNEDGTFSVIQNVGSSTFSGAATYFAGSNAVEAAAGDYNKDGAIDLALLNQGTNDISIVFGVR